MSNAPTTLLGLVPLIRAVVRSETDDTATAVTADDSGTLFINLSTETDHSYTLPTLALGAGKHWIFYQGQTTSTMTIIGGTTDKMMTDDDATADQNKVDDICGASLIVICDGTNYYTIEGKGTWTETG